MDGTIRPLDYFLDGFFGRFFGLFFRRLFDQFLDQLIRGRGRPLVLRKGLDAIYRYSGRGGR